MEIIYTFGVMIISAAVLALLANRLRQPLLLGYVIAGLLLGPAVTGIIDDPMAIMEFFAEFGLILLLFVIGLELDFSKIKAIGKINIIIGTLQIALITAAVFGLALLLGFATMTAVYAGLIVAFSSTIVVVKLLSDKKELDSFHGQQILGILIVEDILAVIGLTLLGAFAGGESHSIIPTLTDLASHAFHLPEAAWFSMVSLAANGVLFVIAAYLFGKHVIPLMFRWATADNDLLFAAAIAVALFLGAVGSFFSFSYSIGAFVAGITLSSAPYNHEVLGRVKPVKDFVLIMFFVALGTLLTFGNFLGQLKTIALLLLAAVLLKPLLIFAIRKAFRYNNRTSLLISLGLAQISEFSLILAMAGVAQGVIAVEFLTGAVIATLLSMMLTAYFIKYDEQLYQFFKPLMAPVENLFGAQAEEHHHQHVKEQPHIIIIGVNAMTAEAIEQLHAKRRLLIIDRNPSRLVSYTERGIKTLCADVFNEDLYEEHIDFSALDTVVSMADASANMFLIRKVKPLKKDASFVVMATTEDSAKKLYKAGATIVLLPELIGRRMLSELLLQPSHIPRAGKEYYAELGKNFVYHRI